MLLSLQPSTSCDHSETLTDRLRSHKGCECAVKHDSEAFQKTMQHDTTVDHLAALGRCGIVLTAPGSGLVSLGALLDASRPLCGLVQHSE